MSAIIELAEIKSVIDSIDVIASMEEGFIQYSKGNTVVPPVAELLFQDPPGDVHIKYGYIKGDPYYCIKIASGFYNNPQLGISSSQGMMLLFNQKTGQPVAILLDEGYLTDIRTAAAGALAAKYFAPDEVSGIGILGTGVQAKLQLAYLKDMVNCRKVWVWGRSENRINEYIGSFDGHFEFHIAQNPADIARNCNLIVTTTPAESPLLKESDIRPGTHITTVGSDTAEKQEIDSKIVQKADLVIADSIPQSKSRGEIYRARVAGHVQPDEITELGTAIQNKELQRINDQQISIADLTGVAVQDIMIVKSVYQKLYPKK